MTTHLFNKYCALKNRGATPPAALPRVGFSAVEIQPQKMRERRQGRQRENGALCRGERDKRRRRSPRNGAITL